jgi:hypothetical protein
MSEANYRSQLRASVRGLWKKVLSLDDFDNAIKATMNRGLTQAWMEGAAECGITEGDLSEAEKKEKDKFIQGQYDFIQGLAEAIQGSKKLQPMFDRVDQWVQRYPEAKANGHAMACSDKKAKFMLGPTKLHCSTCLGLAGRVYRYSVWYANNAVPPHNWNFRCRGGCQCSLVDTSEPITKGSFPRGLLG